MVSDDNRYKTKVSLQYIFYHILVYKCVRCHGIFSVEVEACCRFIFLPGTVPDDCVISVVPVFAYMFVCIPPLGAVVVMDMTSRAVHIILLSVDDDQN